MRSISKVKRDFKKIIRYNKKTRRINRVITRLRYYDRFKDGNSKEVLSLYDRYAINPYVRKQNKRVFRYLIKFKQYLYKFRHKYNIKRIRKVLNNNLNINRNHNFYQITNKIYNNIVDVKYNKLAKIKEYNLDYVDLDKTKYMPYKFMRKYHQSNKIKMFYGKYDYVFLKKKFSRSLFNYRTKAMKSRFFNKVFLLIKKGNMFSLRKKYGRKRIVYNKIVKLINLLFYLRSRAILFNITSRKSRYKAFGLLGSSFLRKFISDKH